MVGIAAVSQQYYLFDITRTNSNTWKHVWYMLSASTKLFAISLKTFSPCISIHRWFDVHYMFGFWVPRHNVQFALKTSVGKPADSYITSYKIAAIFVPLGDKLF